MKSVPIATLALISMVGFTGCSGPAPAPPAESATATASGAIARIRAQIAADKALADSDITVSEEHGTVLLNGTTKSLAQKDAAERIVLEVQRQMGGQGGVLNNLMVR